MWSTLNRAVQIGTGLIGAAKAQLDDSFETLRWNRGLAEETARRLTDEFVYLAQTAGRVGRTRIQSAATDVRGRFDVASRSDLERLETRIEALEARTKGTRRTKGSAD